MSNETEQVESDLVIGLFLFGKAIDDISAFLDIDEWSVGQYIREALKQQEKSNG
jgi:hypothetical protein